ncbi:beta family protein [uncultured Brevundimonas sp.]|uniref:beta family protein n=1 Tax=uncultured Brevundimonas sp. TaxID=213418 RepID=UPI0025EC5185|nr:beta family protein [uncultured Brevundimonas sp.]
MGLNLTTYVPVLKWRQGEYQALLRLDDAAKDRVVPLIEVTPPEWDFEQHRFKKTIDGQLAPFASRLEKKWGSRPAFLDTSLLKPTERMAGGDHPLTFLLDAIRARGGVVVPVTAPGRDLAHYNALASGMAIDGRGVAVRVSLDDIADPAFPAALTSLMSSLGAGLSDTDLIVDLAAKNFEPLADLAALVTALLQSSPIYAEARSLVLIGTSFPVSMGEVKLASQTLPRLEWKLYKAVVQSLPPGFRPLAFGDYAISSADIPGGDMRLLKPSATIRYTVADGWFITKGNNVRDNGYEQYRGQCGTVITSGHMAAAGYSAGSDYIRGCHAKTEKTGNLSTWRWVGTNHHITRVVDDLASFHGP